mgnify:CR=1 FL=1
MTDTSSCAANIPDSRALSAAEARERMLAEVAPISGREFLPVRGALGRILAADIVAPHDVPAHDNSAMAGYAVHFDSLAAAGETRLTVVGTAFAGSGFSGLVGKGQAGDHREADLIAAARVAVAGGEQGAGDAVGAVGRAGEGEHQRVPGDCAHEAVEAVCRAGGRSRRARLQCVGRERGGHPLAGIGAVAGGDARVLPRQAQACAGQPPRGWGGPAPHPLRAGAVDAGCGDAVVAAGARGPQHPAAAGAAGGPDPPGAGGGGCDP